MADVSDLFDLNAKIAYVREVEFWGDGGEACAARFSWLGSHSFTPQ